MNNKLLRGTSNGVMSAILWALDTILIATLLSSIQAGATKKIIFIAPFISAFLHDLCSSMWMIIYMCITKRIKGVFKTIKTKGFKFVVLGALLGGPIGMSGYLLAVNNIGPSYAATISSTYPAIGALFAAIILKERFGKKEFIGLTAIILGVALLGFSKTGNLKSFLGFLFAILSVIGWGLECVVCAYGMKGDEISPREALQIRQFISALFYGIIIMPSLNGFNVIKNNFSNNFLIIIIIAALFATASYVFYYSAIHKIGATKAMGLNITYVVWAMVFEKIFLGNSITVKMIICAIMIMVGSFIVVKEPNEPKSFDAMFQDEKY